MLQIVMAIVGIVVLWTGKLKLSANKVVEGTPARLLGAMLLMPFPLAFAIGLGIGAYVTIQGGNVEELQMPMMLGEMGIVVLTAIVVFGIASAIGKPPGEKQPPGYPPQFPQGPLPPSDPNNPYQSPFTR
jgi:hypothetical protein